MKGEKNTLRLSRFSLSSDKPHSRLRQRLRRASLISAFANASAGKHHFCLRQRFGGQAQFPPSSTIMVATRYSTRKTCNVSYCDFEVHYQCYLSLFHYALLHRANSRPLNPDRIDEYSPEYCIPTGNNALPIVAHISATPPSASTPARRE